MSVRETHVGPNEKPAVELTEKTDDENEIQFGEFLTGQYELLKRTLSKLNIDDLGRAARVCKTWNKTVSFILRQRELADKIRWHVQCISNQCDRLNCYKNDNIMSRSQVILGFQRTKWSGKREIIKQISYCKVTPEGEKTIFPGLKGRAFLISCDRFEVPVRLSDNVFEYSKQRSTALFFPRSNRFKIFSTFYLDESSLHDTIRGEIDLQYGPLQGLLMFASEERESFDVVYNHLCHRFRRSVPLAGGLFSDAVEHLESGKWHRTGGILVLGFHGDVECYSNILHDKKKSAIEPFMKKMKDDLGDIDLRTEQRMAIVIRCVGRANAKCEDNVYRKYFPNMPAFVLYSYGEYGNAGNSAKEQPTKIFAKSDVDIRYAYSSVYFILTIHLPTSTSA